MKELNNNYTAPTLEVLEIQVESGFATSGANENFGHEGGSWN